MTTTPLFQPSNVRFAYQLHYHIGFATRRRIRIFNSVDRAEAASQIMFELCDRRNYRILELEVDDRWVRMLLSLLPSEAPAQTVQVIKSNASRLLLARHPELATELGTRSLWSRGYYVRGVGDITNEVVHQYLAQQYEHHQLVLQNSRLLAEYHHPDPSKFFDLRSFSHCMAEYNCHLVCCPVRHVGAIDPSFAEPLMRYVMRIAAVREFELISLAVLSDHLHLFAALNPKHSPARLALTLMNNTSVWFQLHNPGVFNTWNVPGFWSSSAFLRTAGAVTTNQVRGHLRRRKG